MAKRDKFLEGGKAVLAHRAGYAERGDLDHVATIARLALAEPDCLDAAEIEAILGRAALDRRGFRGGRRTRTRRFRQPHRAVTS